MKKYNLSQRDLLETRILYPNFRLVDDAHPNLVRHDTFKRGTLAHATYLCMDRSIPTTQAKAVDHDFYGKTEVESPEDFGRVAQNHAYGADSKLAAQTLIELLILSPLRSMDSI